MPNCHTCHEDKELTAFERYGVNQYRRECKVCRDARRKQAIQNNRVAREQAATEGAQPPEAPVLPDRCRRCGNPPSDQVQFALRTDRIRAIYRVYCIQCDNARRAEALRNQRQRVALATN